MLSFDHGGYNKFSNWENDKVLMLETSVACYKLLSATIVQYNWLYVTGTSFFFFVFRHEYQIFQKITKLEYEFPEGFYPLARDLVEKLLVSSIIVYIFKIFSGIFSQ